MVDEVKDSLGIESMTSVVVAAAVAYVSYGVGQMIGGASASSAFASSAAAGAAAAGAASSILGQNLAEKPNLPDTNLESELKRNVNTRQPINYRETVYGRVYKGGPFVFMETNADEDVMYLVMLIASHAIEGVESIKFNDSQFVRRHQDNWHSGLISNNGGDLGSHSDAITQVYVHKGNGNASIPQSFLNDTSLNSTDHKFHDVAALFVRMKFDADIWAAGFPTITCVVKGKKLQPIGGGTRRWSNNPAEIIQDYLIDDLGVGVGIDDIDTTSFADCRDYSNEIVDRDTAKRGVLRHIQDSGSVYVIDKSVSNFRPLRDGDKINFVDGDAPAGLSSSTDYFVSTVTTSYESTHQMQQGIRLATSLSSAQSGSFVNFTAATTDDTHAFDRIGEKRFSLDGVARTDKTHRATIQDLLSSFGGELIVSNGKFKLKSPKWTNPIVTLDEDDMVTPIELRAKPTRDLRFNTVTGKLFAPEFNWGVADMESQSVTQFVTDDGQEINQDFDFLFCTNPSQAQRVAKLAMLKSRNDKGISFAMPISGLRFDVGDRFQLNNARLGFTDSNPTYFRIKSMSIVIGGTKVPVVKIDAVEDNSTVYDWDETTDEIVVDPFPDRVLPQPVSVPQITGLTVTERTVIDDNGIHQTNITVNWDIPSSIIQDIVLRLERLVVVQGGSDYFEVDQVINLTARQTQQAEFKGNIGGSRYRVLAYATNYLGVRSAATTSAEINLTGDTVAPSPPTNLTASGGIESVLLSWTNPTDRDFRYADVYRATSATGNLSFVGRSEGNTWVDTTVTGSTTYWYALKAVDFAQNASDFTSRVTGSALTEANVNVPRTVVGYLFYTASSANAPTVTASQFSSYDFNDSEFDTKPANWSETPPVIQPQDVKFWAIRFTVTEATFGGDQTVTISSPYNTLNFDGIVTFTNLADELTDPNATNITAIDGGKIQTGSVAADTLSISNIGELANADIGTITSGKLKNADDTFIIDLDSKFIYITS